MNQIWKFNCLLLVALVVLVIAANIIHVTPEGKSYFDGAIYIILLLLRADAIVPVEKKEDEVKP